MTLSTLLTSLAGVGVGLTEYISARQEDHGATISAAGTTGQAAKKFIIEFASGIDFDQAVKDITSRPGAKIDKVFKNNGIFSGASVITTADNTDSLEAVSSVIESWPAQRIKMSVPLDLTTYSSALTALNYFVHGSTGVDKLHAAGILGKGVKIAIVDTGTDYNHPDLGGCFGPGCKVAGGWDLFGDKEPDDDPMGYNGHGTHVARIVAGESECGYVTDDVLIDAFLTAHQAGVDIITASIGGLSGWPGNAWAEVADRIVNAGTVVTIAAGNDGPYGPFMASSGSSGRNVLAVASCDPDMFPDWELVYIGTACEALDMDLSSKIPLVEISFCSAYIKERNLLAAGAEHVLLFHALNECDDCVLIEDWTMSHAFLADSDGQAIAAAFRDGYNITTTSPPVAIVGVKNRNPGVPSDFTSWGATYDLTLKPDIAAPGYRVLSTWPGNEWASLSRTSMATAYIAGVAALYIGQYGGRSVHGTGFAKMLHPRILASGETAPRANAAGVPSFPGVYANPTQIGNGIINATKVLLSDTELSFTKFTLNDTHHFSRYQGVEITNHGRETVTYTYEVQPAGGYEAFWPNTSDAYQAPRMRYLYEVANKPLEIVPKVKLPSGTTKLQPGETKRVEFIFSIPDGMNYANTPVYGGKVFIHGSDGDRLSVPYFGVGGDLSNKQLDTLWLSGRSLGYPKMFSTRDMTPLNTKPCPRFTFNLSTATQDFPKLLVDVTYGVKEFRWDANIRGRLEDWKERQFKYPPGPGKDGYVGSVAIWAPAVEGGYDLVDPSIDDKSEVVALPIMRIAALTPFGDPTHADNWKIWKTPQIEIRA
ncbi:minor extracellular protease vpr [Coniochaeta sp. 2T2.1]|nr:minor extracellular protease vpr [Coniochaeta sp. 2T2.1]